MLLPNPTIFWLVDPQLKQEISRLEETGLIAKIERQLKQDPEKMVLLKEQHRRYRDFRWSPLTNEHREYARSKGWLDQYQT
jgi:hypothetical protein